LPTPCSYDDEQKRQRDRAGDEAGYGGSEDDRAVDGHEGQEAEYDRVDPRVTVVVAGAIGVPPGGVGDPESREQVIQVESAAPIEAGDFGRAAGGVGIGLGVAPAVVEPERGRHMRHLQDAARRPGDAGGRQPQPADRRFVARGEPNRQSGGKRGHGDTDGPERDEFAEEAGLQERVRAARVV